MRGGKVRILVPAIALLAGWTQMSQGREAPPGRPRVGLVLSGGGTRGLAHIGVLRVLEEYRVPVDCIAGTSMGAVMGGLSPDEIERIALQLDWRDLFTDRPPRKDLTFRQKKDAERYLLPFELGLRKGRLRLPRGLIAGQKLGFLMQSATIRAAGVQDFRKLPVPFHAVAADIETGEMVVLDRGSLPDAMRASMAVPGIFSPVEIDRRLLVDGGIVRNVPVDVARAMGADVVIVVDVGTALLKRAADHADLTGRTGHGTISPAMKLLTDAVNRRTVSAQCPPLALGYSSTPERTEP